MARLNNDRAMSIYGCDYPTAYALNDGLPLSAMSSNARGYIVQRKKALYRGIGWDFTFPTWVEKWRASGHRNERGCTKEGYVMARYDDAGPYSPENVYITTLSQNFRDYHAKKRSASNRCFACGQHITAGHVTP